MSPILGILLAFGSWYVIYRVVSRIRRLLDSLEETAPTASPSPIVSGGDSARPSAREPFLLGEDRLL